MTPEFGFLAGAVTLAGLCAALLADALFPRVQAESALRGYRLSKRQDALERSTLLRLVWPLARFFAGYAQLIPGRSWRAGLEARLVEAGQPAGMTADDFVGINLAAAALGVGFATFLIVVNHMGVAVLALFGLTGLVMPYFYLVEIGQERFKAINRGLPPVLDLIVMAMTAGSDFINALGQVVGKWSRKRDPLYEELSRFLNDLHLGKTRREALEDFAARAPTEVVKTFVGSVVEAERRGTPLVEILAIQAEVARTKRFQRAEQLAGRAGVLVKLPLLLILAACILVMFGGVIIKALRGQLW